MGRPTTPRFPTARQEVCVLLAIASDPHSVAVCDNKNVDVLVYTLLLLQQSAPRFKYQELHMV